MLSENEQWLLSFYRGSEASGALFFGRLARSLPPGPFQEDLTRHFADEARHADLWTRCLRECGHQAKPVAEAYQDRYLEAAGMPANLMDVFAITHVFERRVMRQYSAHRRAPGLIEPIRLTLDVLMEDEVRHVRWVGGALESMKAEYGGATVEAAVARCEAADREVYAAALAEHGERLTEILRGVEPAEELPDVE